MNWQDYGTPRCCTYECAHEPPPELMTDVSRFSPDDFENAAARRRGGADVRAAVGEVNRLVNRRAGYRTREWWEE